MLVCATVGTSSPSVGIEVRFRAQALHVEYIDWHVSCASFSNPNRMNTLAFPIYDDITYSNTTAVSPGWVRLSTKCMNHGIVCVEHSGQMLRHSPRNQWKLQFAPATIDLTVACSMCSKARYLP